MQESDLPKNVSDTHKYKLLATTIMEQVETKQILDSHVDGDINLKQSSDNAPRSFGMRNMRLIGLGGISLMILGILAAGVLFLSGTLNQNNTTDAELITKALQNAQELNIADSNQQADLPVLVTTPQIDSPDTIVPQKDSQLVNFSLILKVVEETNPVRVTGKAPANIKVVNDRDATISVEGTKADFNLYLGVPLEIEGLDGYTQIQPISNDNLTGLFRYVRVLFPDDKVYSNLYKYATEYPNGLRICKASDDTSRGKLGETLPVLVGKRCGLGAISQAKYEGKSPLVAQCQGDSAACDKIMQTVKVEVLPYEYKDNSPVITPIPNPIVNPIIGKDPIPSPKAYEILPSSVKYNPENYIYKDSGLANCGAVDIDNNGKVDSDEMQLLFALESKKCDTRSYLPKEVTSTCGIRDINFSEGIDVNDLDTAMVRLDNRDKCIYFSVIDRQLQPLFCKSIDTNNNGLYDIAEFSSIRENFGRACQNVAPRGKCGTADINNDGLVNVTDFSLFSSNIGKSCATTQPRLVCGALDVNADNKINYTDYHYLSKNFGKTCEDIITTDSLFGLLDVNADKLINVTDFSNLAKYYGKEVMPEPVGTN